MNDWEIRVCHALEGLAELEDESVQCCVTSPPYWGLRDYMVEGQLGLEKTPEEFTAALIEALLAVRRVLRSDGTLWLNLGDSFASGGHGGGGSFMKMRGEGAWDHRSELKGWRKAPPGFKHKDLVGIPWMVANAARAAGWWLRRDVVWHKPNPMPEGASDRPHTSHEMVFLFSKQPRYFYDRSEPESSRSVWTIPVSSFRGAHFATMPPRLAELCILAGSRPGDLVLDPFAGAGTTGLVALRLGRRFLGLELNPEFVEMARNRIRDDAPLLNAPAPTGSPS